jgi:hypothetical protein
MKTAFEKVLGECGWDYVEVETTGLCKKVTGGLGGERHYVQLRRKIFGIPVWKTWVESDMIVWRDIEPIVVEYYRSKENEK